MSLPPDQQAVLDFLTLARLKAEQAIASFVNGDLDKTRTRIKQYGDALSDAKKNLNIFKDRKDSSDAGNATKDDLSK